MRIIRFLDDHGCCHWGQQVGEDEVLLLEGDLVEGLRDTGRRATVRKLLCPLAPSAILAVGLNYRQHAQETGQEVPKRPVLFMKNPASVQHPGDPISVPRCCYRGPEVDYEVELAVVIARPAKDLRAKEALDHVLGYTVANDVSARRWQKHGGRGQWMRSKSFDTFCPMGPALVTPEDLPDPQTLRLRTWLNRELMQDASTSDMIFSVAEVIAEISTDMTLLPGTVILTGTPSGVGVARRPPLFLQPGDLVEMEIERIGRLVSPVVDPGPQPDLPQRAR